MRVSPHVIGRIQMRKGKADITRSDVEIMWENSERREFNKLYYDEARYNDVLDIILLARGGEIVTVILGDRESEHELSVLCEWCGKNSIGRPDCLKCCGYKYDQYKKGN